MIKPQFCSKAWVLLMLPAVLPKALPLHGQFCVYFTTEISTVKKFIRRIL